MQEPDIDGLHVCTGVYDALFTYSHALIQKGSLRFYTRASYARARGLVRHMTYMARVNRIYMRFP